MEDLEIWSPKVQVLRDEEHEAEVGTVIKTYELSFEDSADLLEQFIKENV